ncbi:hypothetical protein [Spiroplasma phoeniceum]|uniref:Uncharacterized protein n=1 Tax=Spiroplasma phoeniceum P40 TaxID=1276259 RepID=A0A345DM09_9MOLU|nr:hypothetical protein [Spiroplasma phoeniceum]AXF95247.1 hypothetical protein SDAV_00252 [Spiroplasma phoeniceum P40]
MQVNLISKTERCIPEKGTEKGRQYMSGGKQIKIVVYLQNTKYRTINIPPPLAPSEADGVVNK